MKILVGAAAVALATLIAVTLVALEGREVVVLQTTTANGSIRQTRVWIADHGGAQWIEAAGPEREFYRDLLANPEVELRRGGTVSEYRASASGSRDGHALIRRLLRAKYGWADVWIGLLADTSESVAVRLEPRKPVE